MVFHGIVEGRSVERHITFSIGLVCPAVSSVGRESVLSHSLTLSAMDAVPETPLSVATLASRPHHSSKSTVSFTSAGARHSAQKAALRF